MNDVDISNAEKAWRRHRADDKRVKQAINNAISMVFDKPKCHDIIEGLMNIAFTKGYDAHKALAARDKGKNQVGDFDEYLQKELERDPELTKHYAAEERKLHIETIESLTAEGGLAPALNALYAQERNVRLQSFWDGGWTVSLGDETNGFTDTARCDNLAEVVEWLSQEGK